jgi:phage gp16-like protein
MSKRRSLLAKIHIAKKELGMSDDQYKAVLAERMGVESASELSGRDLIRLVRVMEDMGWAPKRSRTGALPDDKARQIKRIWAQCYSLGRPVPSYADGLARKMWGVDRVVWCSHDQLQAITSALAYQQRREGAETR